MSLYWTLIILLAYTILIFTFFFKKLADYLSGLDQNVNTSSLDEIAASLVQTPILKHKSNDIQLLAACCLADIIQIYAPDAPYDDSQLQVLFLTYQMLLQF